MLRTKKQKLLPGDQTNQLEQLEDAANRHYRKAEQAWRDALEHAYQSGKALVAAKKLVRHGRWRNWLERAFVGSAETARVYMRIARKWDSPEIAAARNDGIRVDSIQSFLNVLLGKKSPAPTSGRDLDDDSHASGDDAAAKLEQKRHLLVSVMRCLRMSASSELDIEDLEFLIEDNNYDIAWRAFRKSMQQQLEDHKRCYDPPEPEREQDFYEPPDPNLTAEEQEQDNELEREIALRCKNSQRPRGWRQLAGAST